jgi:opacity protein-like surface antigen
LELFNNFGAILMKSLFFSVAVLAAFSTSVLGAESEVKNVFKQSTPNWSGFEIGLAVGATHANLNNQYRHTPYAAQSSSACSDVYAQSIFGYFGSSACSSSYATYAHDFRHHGWAPTSKIAASYSWQNGDFVFGFRVEKFIGKKTASAETPWTAEYGDYITVHSAISPSFSIKSTWGFAVDRFLPFFVVGATWAKIENSYTLQGMYYSPNYFTPVLASRNALKLGAVIGAGVKYSLNENWNLELAYDYTRFRRSSISTAASYATGFSSWINYPDASSSLRASTHSVFFGLSRRW